MGTGTPVPEKEVDEAADPPHARADAGPENVSQETLAARTEEGDHDEVSVTPGVATKSASGGTGSSVGSQSSASQLQKEWVDTTSSAGSGETNEAGARNLTLPDLNK
jgi:hypothetical protein